MKIYVSSLRIIIGLLKFETTKGFLDCDANVMYHLIKQFSNFRMLQNQFYENYHNSNIILSTKFVLYKSQCVNDISYFAMYF